MNQVEPDGLLIQIEITFQTGAEAGHFDIAKAGDDIDIVGLARQVVTPAGERSADQI
jgi:hypothetical protein